MSSRIGSRILVAPDSLAAEQALVSELSQLAGELPLARKTVVVPSHSLRVAVLARLAGLRPAWLGLEAVTLRGLARAILERGGRQHRSGDALLPLLVERSARSERALARHLETLIDGFAGVQGAVRDLLDAGYLPQHLDFALERIEEERGQLGGDVLDRAAALCRIAARSRLELAALGLGVDADLYAAATELLAAEPDLTLPSSALFLHGFADATGVASDLLAEIVRQRPTIAILLEPRELDGESPGSWRFGRRLSERLRGIADSVRIDVLPTPARLMRYDAADPAREMRAAVGQLARAVAAGEPAEDLAIVVRDPAPYRAHLAREIDRQALPASGTDGPPAPLGRRARGLLELVERQGDASLGLAFAVAGEFLARGTGVRPWELRLAALAMGVRKLGAFAELKVELDPVPLPMSDRFVEVASGPEGGLDAREVTEGGEESDDGDETGGADRRLSLRSRSVPRQAVRRAQLQAAALLARLAAQNRLQSLGQAVAGIVGLVEILVEREDERATLAAPLDLLAEAAEAALAAATTGAGFEVTAAEAALLLRDAWRDVGAAALGGRGGGVALLSVTEARGRTFRRIVLAGLARDRFPRTVRADPFLPDSLRLRLRDLLPDLPVKREGHDEERFLFAQLLGAAPEVDLLTPKADEDGKALSPSSFLDELRRAGRIGAALPAPDSEAPSALDLACRTALENPPADLAAALAEAYREGEERFAVGEVAGEVRASAAEAWTASHLALLSEFGADPTAPQAAALGPFFGFVGERPATNVPPDPRRIAPAVTTLQGVAGCGWRTFLGKVLRLAAPLAGEDEIPELPSRLTGTVVHAVLERMAPTTPTASMAPQPPMTSIREVRTLDAAEAQAEVDVRWPEPAALQTLIAAAAREALGEEGLDPELFALPLELAATEALAVVERRDWPGGSRRILGLEVEGEAVLELAIGARRLTFRADRIERDGEALLLTDYKTGKKVVSAAAKAETRERHLEKALAEGEWLQLPAYARARSAGPVEGRLLFLKQDLEDDRRDVRLAAPAPGSLASERERQVWQTLFDAWEGGTFLPRLLDSTLEESYAECAYCEVRAACVQGDTGARLRLERWVRSRLESASASPGNAADSAHSGGPDRPVDKAWRLFSLKPPRPHAAEQEES